MRVYKLDDPLKPYQPLGYQALTVPLNIAESKIRSVLSEPYSKKIDIIDLSETFDLGIELVIVNGMTKGFVERPVF